MAHIVSYPASSSAVPETKAGYNRFLLLVAGLGGLLYGVDVGIIGGALPYLEATSRLNAGQLSSSWPPSCSAASSPLYLPVCSPTGWAASP